MSTGAAEWSKRWGGGGAEAGGRGRGRGEWGVGVNGGRCV